MHPVGAGVKEIALMRERAISPNGGRSVEYKLPACARSKVAFRFRHPKLAHLNDTGQRVKTPLAVQLGSLCSALG
jgi:hypothetical protein